MGNLSPQQRPWPQLPVLAGDRINGILVNQMPDPNVECEDDAPEILECREQREYELFWYNLACCLFHFIQAIIVLALGLGSSTLGKFKLPLTTVFTVWPRGYPQQELIVRGYLPFVAATSGFAFMSAVAHASVLIGYSCYVCDLRRRINRFRWVEYAFSSSWMIALIAMLFGCYDILTLVLIASVNACMIWFGWLMETSNIGRKPSQIDWDPFIFGAFAGAVEWAVVFAYASSGSRDIPGFVWGILAAYVIMFQTFPINMGLQYSRISYWSDRYWGFQGGGYYLGEVVYCFLSLIAKTLLLWLVVGGGNQPSNPLTN